AAEKQLGPDVEHAERMGVNGQRGCGRIGRGFLQGLKPVGFWVFTPGLKPRPPKEEYSHKNTEPPGRVCVLCGKGNNGGDGFVVARDLREEAEHVEVYLFAQPEELRGEAAKNFERWREQGGRVTVIQSEAEWEDAWPQIAAAEVIFDALLGTGIRGAASGLLAQAIEDLNRLSQNATAAHPAWIVAVDTPSGLPSDGEAAA